MSWHRQWHQSELRPEGPASTLRQAMRQQMRDDVQRMVVTPKDHEDLDFREPSTRPPNPLVQDVPDIFISDDQWRV